MPDESKREDVAATMRRINQAWIEDRVQDMSPLLHPEIVMAFPGFTGSAQGRQDFLAGFRDFRQNATIHEYREHDYQVDAAGDTAVVTFRYDMVYERSGERFNSTGRDLWVFQRLGAAWIAVWRAMLDADESAT